MPAAVAPDGRGGVVVAMVCRWADYSADNLSNLLSHFHPYDPPPFPSFDGRAPFVALSSSFQSGGGGLVLPLIPCGLLIPLPFFLSVQVGCLLLSLCSAARRSICSRPSFNLAASTHYSPSLSVRLRDAPIPPLPSNLRWPPHPSFSDRRRRTVLSFLAATLRLPSAS